MPKGTIFGKMENSSIKQAINFANRNNIQEEGYHQSVVKTQRTTIENILSDARNPPLSKRSNISNSKMKVELAPKNLVNCNRPFEKSRNRRRENTLMFKPLKHLNRRGSNEIKESAHNLQWSRFSQGTVSIPKLNNYLNKYKHNKLTRRSLMDQVGIINEEVKNFHKKHHVNNISK